MSWAPEPAAGRRRGRGALAVLLALLAVAGLLVGGWRLSAQSATFRPDPIPLVGRTSTVCSLAPAVPGGRAAVAAAVTRKAPGREGKLTFTPLGQGGPVATLTRQGDGRVLAAGAEPLVLRGEGVMATASSGEVIGTATSGPERGLMAAPCGVPATEHWLVGVGAEPGNRSALVLTNPDDARAEVDLHFYGATGEVTVPGSPGVAVPAHGSRVLALESLAAVEGPLSLSVRATVGRVAAVTRDLRSTGLAPAGADWHVPAVPPARTLLIPGVPAGEGPRRLLVVNPGASRARVRVQVQALTGSFDPVGAASVDVAARSTAGVDLAPAMLGQAGAVALSSSSPVTASVVATSTRAGAAADVAVQPATAPLTATGVVALAAVPGADSDLVLSNGTDQVTSVALEVVGYDGVSQQSDDVLLGPHSTSTRRVRPGPPAYLEVTVPDGSRVHGAVVYNQPEGPVAGLATVSLSSPDVARRAPRAVPDPSVGR